MKVHDMPPHGAGPAVVPEHEMKALIASYGVSVPAGALCTDPDAALAAAKGLYPVALKLVSDRVLHKTELGGVRLNVASPDELRDAFTGMDARFRNENVPGYRGILVEAMAAPGVEIIAGLQHDPVFGPVLMVGTGGTMTDILRDVAFRALPATETVVRGMLAGLKGRTLLEGFRGGEAADVGALVETLCAIARFGTEHAGEYESVDFNPVRVGARGCTVLDAKMVPAGAGAAAGPTVVPNPAGIDAFFMPKSVAVVGASATAGKIGNVILDSLVRQERDMKIYPVNNRGGSLMGLDAYATLRDLPEAPDLAIVAVDLELMPALLGDMAAIGTRAAIIVSGGGKELGGDRAGLESRIASEASRLGIRLVGPNCIGAFEGHGRFDSFFYPRERFERPPAGPMAFITQSGTWGCAFMEEAAITGMSKMVSYGNRIDVDEGDLLAYLSGDADTRVIGCYVEGLSAGRKFVAGLDRAVKSGKPVVVFKSGRTGQAAHAAVSHTGAYGGSYEVFEGALAQHGAVLTDSFHECFAACEALALQPPAKGNRAALLSNGAGPMINALDLFPRKGLTLAELSPSGLDRMKKAFSYFYIVSNPVDVTGSATAADYEFVIETLMDDDGVDIIMPFFVFQNAPLDESIVERLAALNRKGRKPVLCCAAGGDYTARMSARLKKEGVPVFPDVARWVAAASAMARWSEIRSSLDKG